MQSGIKIKSKKRFGQFLITAKPYAIIDDGETLYEFERMLAISE
jgi:hypothetical protein